MLGKTGRSKFLLSLLVWASSTVLLANTVVCEVRQFKDESGTIVITNQRRQTTRSPSREVVRSPNQSFVQPASGIIPSSFPASETPPRPGASAPAAGQGPQAPKPPESEGGILRYQDGQGILHITNVDRQDKRLPPQGEQDLALGPYLRRARVTAASVQDPRPPVQMSPKATLAREASGANNPVKLRRKRDGTYVITNLVPRQNLGGEIPEALKPILAEASLHYALPLPLLVALVKAESNFNPQAVSPKGAMGLMQLMPGTASDLGVRDPFCPRENILAGCRYFRDLLDRFDQSLPLALAAYNAGSQRVVNAGYRVPGIKETQEFVTRVLEKYYRTAHPRLWF